MKRIIDTKETGFDLSKGYFWCIIVVHDSYKKEKIFKLIGETGKDLRYKNEFYTNKLKPSIGHQTIKTKPINLNFINFMSAEFQMSKNKAWGICSTLLRKANKISGANNLYGGYPTIFYF